MIDQNTFGDTLLTAAERNELQDLLLPHHIAAFYTLTEHMLVTNEKFNLTAIKEPKKIILLHYIDSLMGARYFPENATIIDIGSGAGFPSLPLAIVRPDLKITAMDATEKRVNYVKETAKMLGLSNLSTLVGRAEDLSKDPLYREKFDCATARAVANLPVLCELCLPFVRCGGTFIAMKGRSGKQELLASENAIKTLGGKPFSYEETPIVSPEDALFEHTTVIIQKTTRTPEKYPRAYGKILKAPL